MRKRPADRIVSSILATSAAAIASIEPKVDMRFLKARSELISEVC